MTTIALSAEKKERRRRIIWTIARIKEEVLAVYKKHGKVTPHLLENHDFRPYQAILALVKKGRFSSCRAAIDTILREIAAEKVATRTFPVIKPAVGLPEKIQSQIAKIPFERRQPEPLSPVHDFPSDIRFKCMRCGALNATIYGCPSDCPSCHEPTFFETRSI